MEGKVGRSGSERAGTQGAAGSREQRLHQLPPYCFSGGGIQPLLQAEDLLGLMGPVSTRSQRAGCHDWWSLQDFPVGEKWTPKEMLASAPRRRGDRVGEKWAVITDVRGNFHSLKVARIACSGRRMAV